MSRQLILLSLFDGVQKIVDLARDLGVAYRYGLQNQGGPSVVGYNPAVEAYLLELIWISTVPYTFKF